MKRLTLILFLFLPQLMQSQAYSFQLKPEKFTSLSFGSVLPDGWLKNQMISDLNGFVGNLDLAVPDLINDPIYIQRLKKNSKQKDLGNLKEGDAAGDEQYKWWNSETQSNWWDGYIRNVLLTNDKYRLKKVKNYISKILASQDDDGYLGIYDAEMRYNFKSENAELWSKTTLFRGLLAYYEFSRDEKILNALIRAVENVMENYPTDKSDPFDVGTEFSGGVAHGLTFTDVCEQMYKITGNNKYRKYALFLYHNFSIHSSSEKDVQLYNILNPGYRLQCHAVHTFEHLRPLIVASYSTKNDSIPVALNNYLKRIDLVTTVSGAPIGDEWIDGRLAHETETGYEYCSMQELTDSYSLLLEKTGNNSIAEKIENIFFNAAQGARNPVHSGIAYLKTDNSFQMNGTKNGQAEADRKQTRYKYSPAHQDVAVCCNPNAGRITPYYVQNMWMKEGENTMVATLLGPSTVKTTLNNSNIQIKEITNYPFSNNFVFEVKSEKNISFILKIRIPEWASKINCNESYTIDNEYISITTQNAKVIKLSFDTEVKSVIAANRETSFRFGALLYAYPIAFTESKGRQYTSELYDYFYLPSSQISEFYLAKKINPVFENNKIQVNMIDKSDNQSKRIELIPLSKTILRQITFKQ